MTGEKAAYQPLFDPDAAEQPFDESRAGRTGDRVDESDFPEIPYVYDDRIVLAVNVALAAGRPLLVRGRPGTGKSSLAHSVARKLGWSLHAITVSSRITARDLLWSFDSVRRLAEAQALTRQGKLPERRTYVTPGVLWKAFDPASAQPLLPEGERAKKLTKRSVVLIDEIDKADPDFPNDLLVPLGSYRFRGDDGGQVVAGHPPLIIITTNEERDLPRAFLRRCVILQLEEPRQQRLREIARAHFADLSAAQLESVLTHYLQVRERRLKAKEQAPSIAEFLDALAALRGLGMTTQHPRWKELEALLLDKATTPSVEQV
ncbi:MAG TPA: MoxR family ATPase [Actinoplanes sp.]|nr:MoxR family ATPase [Actinoplanes sp.]